MKKISYSKDVDALLIGLSDAPIAYAEDEGQVILHYSDSDQHKLIAILDFRSYLSKDTMGDLLSVT
ncbi:MAG: DUF2283 domain-containing protein [Cyanobacteria bacterium P01_A01_bin.114]